MILSLHTYLMESKPFFSSPLIASREADLEGSSQ
jgi:hypothetical protein